MRYPPERRDALLALIRDWTTAGATRADIMARLAAMGHCQAYRCQLTRDANKRYNLGWDITTTSASHDKKERGIAALLSLAAEGKTRADACRIVAAQFECSPNTADRWAKARGIHFHRPQAPVTNAVPPEAHSLVTRIAHDLRGEQEPVVTPCEHPAEGDGGTAWGAAACWGEPVSIVLAHDYDDWQRQYTPRQTLQEAGD